MGSDWYARPPVWLRWAPLLPLVRKPAGHGVVELTHPSVRNTYYREMISDEYFCRIILLFPPAFPFLDST